MHIRNRLLFGFRASSAEQWLHRFTTTLPDDPKLIDFIDRWLRRVASSA
jgi:hypothetical protein